MRRLQCMSRSLVLMGIIWPSASAFGDELPKASDPPPFSDVPLHSTPAEYPHTNESTDENTKLPVTSSTAAKRASQEIMQVNNLGDAETIEFRGVSLFPVDDIRSALRWDPKYQAAARPSNTTGNFLAVLESRLRNGYQSSGCPEAKVRAWRSASLKKIVVDVQEGPHYRTGMIIVTGTSHVDHAQLVHWLTTSQLPRRWQARYGPEVLSDLPDDGNTIWTSDENLDYSEQQQADLESGVRRALIEQGFPYTPFTIELNPANTAGVADLHVDLAGDPVQSTVSKVEVHGLQRDTREQLLTYLEVAPGDCFDAALLDRIDKKLSDSCRYWIYTVTAHFASQHTEQNAASDDGVTLVLELEEFAPAPPLNQPLSEVDEILRKAAAWINRFQTDGSADLIIEKQPKVYAGLTESITIRRSAFAADGRVALDVQYESPTVWSLDLAFIATSRSLDMVDWRNRERFTIPFDNIARVECKITPDRKENGDYAQLLFFGWAATSRSNDNAQRDAFWTIRAEPVALVYTAYRPGVETHVENGVLTASASGIEVSFDAMTGAFVSLRADNGNDGIFVARLQRGGFDAIANSLRQRAKSFANRFDAGHPVDSALRITIQQLQRQPAIVNQPTLNRFCGAVEQLQKLPSVVRLISRLDDEWVKLSSSGSPTDGEPKFSITAASPCENDSIEEILRRNVIYYVPGLADMLFPRGTWPWTLSREAAFSWLADDTAEDSVERWNRIVGELARLERTKQLSPIAAMLCTQVTGRGTSVRAINILGSRIASCGLRQSTDDVALEDVRLLVTGDHAWAKFVRSLAEELEKLPTQDQRHLVAILPDACSDILTQYIARRNEKPDEPIGDALEQVLLDRWHIGLREAVETQLRSYTTNAAQTAKASK